MERLASELLHHICTLACTDGGFTGCSLSLVSQYMRAASRSTRFHSIAISGTSKQLDGFLSCLEKERAANAHTYKPAVKHLFFAAAEGGEIRKDWRGDPRNPSLKAARAHYGQNLALLLRIVAKDLQTLCFVHCHGWYSLTNLQLSDVNCPKAFPALRELSLYGTNPFVQGPTHFPRLTHLHLTFAAYSVAEKIKDWADCAPSVTHLCVSDIRSISQELEDIAANGGPFDKLSQLYLQPRAPPPSGGRCGRHAYWASTRFINSLDAFVAAAHVPTKARRHQI
ncbi:hypothetical protein K466DRAFT_92742 [Polyporus arcularius HHB13444]|uniref:F-box domain-containing protein n=1 Tax=Polyporus arcularius HHB13444 TaxID=1314778 RepID=A0A5C3PV04_9APHY|nr:hypothetical protein K466DRAFT_92742 [Polyporus arcularius HHB13444]